MPWKPEHRPRSLGARLLVAYTAAWLALAGLMGGTLAWILFSDRMRWADHSALELAHALAGTLKRDATGAPLPPALPGELGWLVERLPLDVVYRVFDAQGRVVLWSSPEAERAWAGSTPMMAATARRLDVQGLTMRIQSARLRGEEPALWLEAAMSERLIRLLHARDATHLGGTVLVTVLASIALFVVVQFVVLRHLLRPVRQLAQQTSDIDLHRPGRRLATAGLPQEVQPLVVAFNACLQRMEEAHTRHVSFMADAAHELKTPLMLLRAQLELGDADPQALLTDVDQLSRQVQQWLVLAEVTERQSYRHETIDVQAVARDTLRRLTPLAEQRHVDLRLQGEPGPAVQGDPSALAVLLKNLVENAIHAAPANTAVTLHLAGDSVHVRDHGPGIAAQHLPHLFQRFWRAPERRDAGAGLGLSICAEVAQAHGWQLCAINRQPGAEFTLRLASSPPPPDPTTRASP